MSSVSGLISGAATYNPLAQNVVEKTIHADEWVCTSSQPVRMYLRPSLDGEPQKELHHGDVIRADKEGEWLAEKVTDMYAPFHDEAGNRNFKNMRTVAMEEAVHEGDGFEIRKPGSSKSWTSDNSDPSKFSRKHSFRWVDHHGNSHRVENDSDLHNEVWICVSIHNVPFRNSKNLADVVEDKECLAGSKVNAIREDDWLRVLEVTAPVDAAELIGRRSFRIARHMVIKETGYYLPIHFKNERLFMSEKLALFEATAGPESQDPRPPADDHSGGCAVM